MQRWETRSPRYVPLWIFPGNFLQLIGLLRDKNPFVRQLALENLLPYTQSANPHLNVWKANNWEGARLLKILVRETNVCAQIRRV